MKLEEFGVPADRETKLVYQADPAIMGEIGAMVKNNSRYNRYAFTGDFQGD